MGPPSHQPPRAPSPGASFLEDRLPLSSSQRDYLKSPTRDPEECERILDQAHAQILGLQLGMTPGAPRLSCGLLPSDY